MLAGNALAADIAPGVERFIAMNGVRCHGPDKQKGTLRFDVLPSTISDAAVALTFGAMPFVWVDAL